MVLGPKSWDEKKNALPWDDEAPETTAVPFPPNCCWSSRWRSSWTWPATICYPFPHPNMANEVLPTNLVFQKDMKSYCMKRTQKESPYAPVPWKPRFTCHGSWIWEPRNRLPNSVIKHGWEIPELDGQYDGKIIYRWGGVPFPCLITEWRLGCDLYIFGFISVMSVWEENLWASQMQSFTYSRRVVENGM